MSDLNKQWTCHYPECTFTTFKKYKLEEHVRSHTGAKPCVCNVCGKSFRRCDHLKRHQKTHLEGNLKRSFACDHPGCSASFVLRHHLKRHQLAHVNPTPYSCVFRGCTASFAKKVQLRRHVKECEFNDHASANIDSKDLHHVCKVCNSEFRDEERLFRHLSRHVDIGDVVPCPCEDCNDLFPTMEALHDHVQSLHPGFDLACSGSASPANTNTFESIMDDSLQASSPKSPRRLRRKVSSSSCGALTVIFEGSPRGVFECEFPGCDKAFVTRSNLNSHVRSAHSSVRNYACSVCAKAFAFSYLLRRHISRMHPSAEGRAAVKSNATKHENALPDDADADADAGADADADDAEEERRAEDEVQETRGQTLDEVRATKRRKRNHHRDLVAQLLGSCDTQDVFVPFGTHL
eukprot:ANDGO_02110.mRNA.1 Transcription factor IIIA